MRLKQLDISIFVQVMSAEFAACV